MKKFWIACFVFAFLSMPLLSFAQDWSWWNYGGDPITVLDRVVQESNSDYKIQQTALDKAIDKWGYSSQYKVANTLDRLRDNIAPYIQYAVFIGLALGVILLIYNGFLMVTNAVHGEWDFAKIKKRFMYILVGVLLLTGFYFIIKLTVSIINSIFGWYGWTTWF